MVTFPEATEKAISKEIASEFDLDDDFPEFKGWEMIGFHRPIGNEMWQFSIEILGFIITLFTIGIFVPLIYPYPEIQGYEGIANSVFVIANRLFDIGVGYGISRFIAEYRIKNTERMLMYIRFYIWYQMFSGALQITIISFIVFRFTIFSQFSYVTWLILFGLQKQWPGMLGIFRTIISGLQHFDKANILMFLQGKVFQEISRILFILLGRWYGINHPEMGMLLGMAIGYAIGGYIDDILITFLELYMLRKIFLPIQITLRDMFILRINKEVVKESLFYGFQASMYPIIDTFTYTIIFYWYVDSIPALATWTTLSSLASGITGVSNIFGNFALTTSIAESYSNEKEELAEWYVTMNVKWRYFFTMIFVFSLIAAYPYIDTFLAETSGLEYYKGALIFFFPHLFVKSLDPLKELPDHIFNGAKYITAFNVLRILEEAIEVGFVYLWLFVFEVQNMGMFGLIFLVGFKTRVSVFVKTIIAYIYIQKYILKVRIAWYSSIGITSLSASPIILLSWIWNRFVFEYLFDLLGSELSLILTIVVVFAPFVCFIYLPLTGVLGWWDDYEFYIFKKATALSGPSKFIFQFFVDCIEYGIRIGRKIGTHGKYSISSEVARQQIKELMEMKRNETTRTKSETN